MFGCHACQADRILPSFGLILYFFPSFAILQVDEFLKAWNLKMLWAILIDLS